MPLAVKVVLLLVACVAAIFDLRVRRIPNWLVLAGLVLGIGLNCFLRDFDHPLRGLLFSLEGIGVASLIYLPLYMLRGMGAGDVKLMMAVGSLAGPVFWFFIFVLTGISGGVIAVILLLSRGRLRKTMGNVMFLLHSLLHFRAPYAANEELDVGSSKGVRLPHGAVIALGTLVFLVVDHFMAV